MFKRQEKTPIVPLKATQTLSGVRTPHELSRWCQINLKPAGRLCRRLNTAEEMICEKEGSDWEIANFVFHELTSLGYEASILFITRDDHLICRSSVLYRDNDNVWWWCLWRPDDVERINIFGGFKSINHLLAMAKGSFEFDFEVIEYSKLGRSLIQPDWTFVEYLEMVSSWPKAPRRDRKA